jgi:NADPH-dependent curcumin reductase CurA
MSTKVSNNCVVFTKVPEEFPVINEHFKIVERQFDISSVVLEKDEILIKNLYMSLDPYLRGRMRPKDVKSYVNPFIIGEVMETLCIGVVIKSNNAQWEEGDLYSGLSGK